MKKTEMSMQEKYFISEVLPLFKKLTKKRRAEVIEQLSLMAEKATG